MFLNLISRKKRLVFNQMSDICFPNQFYKFLFNDCGFPMIQVPSVNILVQRKTHPVLLSTSNQKNVFFMTTNHILIFVLTAKNNQGFFIHRLTFVEYSDMPTVIQLL